MLTITIEKSDFLKGIAILLMLIHHSFGFPNQVESYNSIISLFGDIRIEYYLGILGKICVSIFLFLSGFGFSISNKKATRYYLSKIISFLKSYWLVFFIFYPIAKFLFQAQIANMSVTEFMLNLITLSNSFNGEWWFAQIYIALLLMLPLINKLRHMPLALTIISLNGVFLLVDTKGFFNQVLLWQPAFIYGYVFGVYQNQLKKVSDSAITNFIIFLVTTSLFFLIYHSEYSNSTVTMLSSPLFVISCLYIEKISPQWLKKAMIELGKKSLYMWLTHSFYCYYLLQDFIYWPKHSILILLNLFIVSYITAVILSYLMNVLDQFIAVIKRKFVPTNNTVLP